MSRHGEAKKNKKTSLPVTIERTAATKCRPLASVASVTAASLIGRNDKSSGSRSLGGRSHFGGWYSLSSSGSRGAGDISVSRGSSVPIRPRVAKTFSDSDEPVPAAAGCIDHVRSQVVHGLVVDIMSKDNVLVAGRVGRHARRVPVLGVLDQLGTVILVVLGVDVLVHDMVAQSGHLS